MMATYIRTGGLVDATPSRGLARQHACESCGEKTDHTRRLLCMECGAELFYCGECDAETESWWHPCPVPGPLVPWRFLDVVEESE